MRGTEAGDGRQEAQEGRSVTQGPEVKGWLRLGFDSVSGNLDP
jgi:hypothetical protein